MPINKCKRSLQIINVSAQRSASQGKVKLQLDGLTALWRERLRLELRGSGLCAMCCVCQIDISPVRSGRLCHWSLYHGGIRWSRVLTVQTSGLWGSTSSSGTGFGIGDFGFQTGV